MRIIAEDDTFCNYMIYLNDRHVKTALAADDEEGWVEVLDVAAMAPLDLTSNQEFVDGDHGETEPMEMPIKRLVGSVAIVKFR